MKITKDLWLVCDMLNAGFFMIEHNVLDTLNIVTKHYDVKGKYLSVYINVLFYYKYVGNDFRTSLLFYDCNSELSKLIEGYQDLKNTLLQASKRLNDFESKKMINAEMFLTMLYDVIMEAVKRESESNKVYNDLKEIHSFLANKNIDSII